MGVALWLRDNDYVVRSVSPPGRAVLLHRRFSCSEPHWGQVLGFFVGLASSDFSRKHCELVFLLLNTF